MPVSNSEVKSFHAGFFTIVKFVLFLGLGILIIWLSLKGLTPGETQEIANAFRTANYNWVLLAIFLGILSHILRALRWIMFLEPMGYKPRLRNTFYAVMIGYFANLAFPRLGEITRCGILAKYEKIPFQKSFGTVITERAIDMLMFFGLFLLMIFTQMENIREYLDEIVYPKLVSRFGAIHYSRLLLITVAGILVIVLVLFLLFRKKILSSRIYHQAMALVSGFWEGLKSLIQVKYAWLFILYTLLIWLLYFFMLYTCFFCFPETSGLTLGAGLSALVLGSVGIIITPGGIGLYPAIIQETMRLYGTSLVTGLALGWIAWSSQTLMVIIVGGMSLLLLTFNKSRYGTAQPD